MAREWKPGDVGLSDSRDVLSRVLRVASCGDLKHRGPGDAGCKAPHWHFATGGFTFYDEYVRPLVVIDPEDREQIERLGRVFRDECGKGERRLIVDGDFDALQAAFREFAEWKPPKPDEPTGLGAVVEDAAGELFVADFIDDDGEVRWYGPRTTRAADVYHHTVWSRIDAVRVLSEGVTP